MNTLICIQARMSSTRLPGKVMLPLAGAPLLQRMIERVRAAKVAARIVVITSSMNKDDRIEELCRAIETDCFRGHPTDLLDRHYQAAKHYGASVIAKIPSDCPLIDPSVIEKVFQHFDSTRFDYVSNLHPATYPDGNDVEIVSFQALETAWQEADRSFEREHTTPFLWERPERFRIGNVAWETGMNYSMSHRWTIDYPNDYEFIREIYDHFWRKERPIFSSREILNLIEKYPEIATINAGYAGVNWYRDHLNDLRTVTSEQTRPLQPEFIT
ncbi:MAG TPA: glycosyltransferase family protein [Candidatus Kapabacteria bacterium]|jgi:spore coat polysaccharide biosynthesis protein SpsF